MATFEDKLKLLKELQSGVHKTLTPNDAPSPIPNEIPEIVPPKNPKSLISSTS